MKLSELRNLLTEMDFHPRRAWGQNFLIDGNILDILPVAGMPTPIGLNTLRG